MIKTFPVTGMTCAACAQSVESMLGSVEGVQKASVNLANSWAVVEYLPEQATPEAMRNAVRSIGYDLVITEGDQGRDEFEKIQEAYRKKLKIHTFFALSFSLPLVIIGMFWMDLPYANYIMWALATPVIFVFGGRFFVQAWKQLKNRSANMDTLVALSAGTGYLFSVFNVLFPEFWHAQGLHAHVYFESVAVVISFILLGKWLEEKAKSRTSSAIKKLMGLQPKTVIKVDAVSGEEKEIPVADVQPGDVLLAKPGEKIAVDGMVVSGNSFVDESMITGEPVPSAKTEASLVYAGTINQKGSFRYKAEKTGSLTVLGQIIQMVQEAQGSKVPLKKLADKIASVFVPVVIAIAVITLVIWWMAGGAEGFLHGLSAMLTVLVIACPCALGLATPAAIMVGIGKGAENGIFIKDAENLELACKANAIVLDKTGTVTEGKPSVAEIRWADEYTDHALYEQVLYALENESGHPLAEAVVNFLGERGTKPVSVNLFHNVEGKGAEAFHGTTLYLAGSLRFLEEKNIEISASLRDTATVWNEKAYTMVWFANRREALAVIGITDRIKKNSAKAVHQLQQMDIEVFMLTGDNRYAAKAVAGQTGIKNYEAEMLPAQKSEFIKNLQSQGKTVIMTGDGINDAQALAQADVSIAMGKGTDIAMNVAKMTILSSDLIKIPQAIHLSGKTVSLIRQNFFWAFIYNLVGIPIAAGVLYPFTGFLLDPMIAGAAMALSSVSVLMNSLRLNYVKLEHR